MNIEKTEKRRAENKKQKSKLINYLSLFGIQFFALLDYGKYKWGGKKGKKVT